MLALMGYVWRALPVLALSALFFGMGGLPARADTEPDTTGPLFSYAQAIQFPESQEFGLRQTALKSGDTFGISAEAHDPSAIQSMVADLSELGAPSPIPLLRLDDIRFQSLDLPVGKGISSGTKTVTVTATDGAGNTSTRSFFVLVDNDPPTVAFTDFHTIDGQPMKNGGAGALMSGTLDGTGSTLHVIDMRYCRLHADKSPFPNSCNMQGVPSELIGLHDGAFTGIPVRVEQFDPTAAYMQLVLMVADNANNVSYATSSPLAMYQKPTLSNVLFLPGIEGSELYRGAGGSEAKLWDPSFLGGDQNLRDLFLDIAGKSVRTDIHTTVTGTLQSPYGADVYRSFLSDLHTFCTGNGITCVETPYDWRLALQDILSGGTLGTDGTLSYLSATSTPYIEQTLRALAATSATGKVTIIAHSNGGLVAKALLQKIGDADTAALVDKVVLVAVPQSGTVETAGQLLVGHDAGLPAKTPFIISPVTTRQFAQNSPMAYHLLPSAAYFRDVQDPAHPVVSFSGTHAYTKEVAAYGATVDSESEFMDYLLAREGGRTRPDASDLSRPGVANATLAAYAHDLHTSLDAWRPPANVMVYQIAGWGVDTLAGIDFYELPGPLGFLTGYHPEYRPDFVEDGDGAVPTASALMMPVSENVKSYWLDLATYNKHNRTRDHGTLLGTSDLQSFLRQILFGTNPAPSALFSLRSPTPKSTQKELRIYIHSPVSLSLTDSLGNHTGLLADGTVEENIPGSSYGQFGEVKYILVPAGTPYTLALRGLDTGSFSLDLQEVTGSTVTASSTIANVPVTPSTTASLTLTTIGESMPALHVDETGDGSQNILLTPVSGQVVSYSPAPAEPPAAAPVAGSIVTTFPTLPIPATPLQYVPMVSTPTTTLATYTPPVALYVPSRKLLGSRPAAPRTKLPAPTSPTTSALSQTAAAYNAVSQQHWTLNYLQRIYSFIKESFHFRK